MNKFFMLLRNVCDVIVEKLKMLFSLHLAKRHFNFCVKASSKLSAECKFMIALCIVEKFPSQFPLAHHHSELVLLLMINALWHYTLSRYISKCHAAQ